MELIARDVGGVGLAVLADGFDNGADGVVVVDGLADSLVGDIHAVVLLQGKQDVLAKLNLVVLKVVPVALHGRVHDGGEEALVFHRVQKLKMLLHALHGGAGLCTEEGI